MTRKRSSPLGLEVLVSLVAVLLVMLPALTQAAPLQEYTEIQQYPEGCYYNYAHYNEGDRIMTNEPCLNCTCHNRMLMCYLRVCPFTKPIGHDCIVEKREDQCCPIITCPEVPVDVPYHTPEPGTELSIPEKFGCSIEEKFYPEGAQVPSNPNKPCELCYCINNQTKCVMQECTLHVDGCTPIYNKGSCCPVRYSCDHENDVLELEDQSTTTTTVRPTPGFILTTTMTPTVSMDCIHNGETYADGASIKGKNACEHCYCMRGDIVCAVQECEMPMSTASGKSCRAMPAAEGECCPKNYICEDDSATTEIVEITTQEISSAEGVITTAAPVKDIHGEIPKEDVDLQEHIDDEEKDKDTATEAPGDEMGSGEVDITVAPEHDDKLKEKEPEASTVAADSRIDIPPESSTAASDEEGSGETTTSRVQEAAKPTESPKEGSGEDEIVKPTISVEEGSGEVEDIAGSTSKPATILDTEDTVKATTETAEVSHKEEDIKSTTAAKEIGGEEDIVKSTTPAAEDTDTDDVSKGTTPAKEESSEDVTKTTTPSKEISSLDDVTKATTPVGEEAVEQDTKKPSTSEEDTVKSTTPTSDEKEVESATAPSKEDSTEDDIKSTTAKGTTTPAEIVSDEKDVESSTTPFKEASTEDDIKSTTPKGASSEEDIVKATTPAGEDLAEQHTDKSTTSTGVSDEEIVPTTSPSEIGTDEHKDIEKPSESPISEESIPSSTDIADASDEDDTTKPTTPIKQEQPEDKVDITKTTTSRPVEQPTEAVDSSTDYSTEKDVSDEVVHATTIPSHISSSSTEGISSETTPEEEKPAVEGTTDVPIYPGDKQEQPTTVPAIVSDEKESGEKEVDESQPEPPKKDATTDKETSTEKIYEDVTEAGKETSTEKVDEDSTEADKKTSTEKIDEKSTETDKDVVSTTSKPLATSEEPTEGVDKDQTTQAAPAKSDIAPDVTEADQTTAQPAKEEEQTTDKPSAEYLPPSSEHIDSTEKVETSSEIPASIEGDTTAATTGESTPKPEKPSVETRIDFVTEQSTSPSSSDEDTTAEALPDMQLPAVIPGEGDCLVEGKTYANNTNVPATTPCDISCKCISSIVSCKPMECKLPENREKCVLATDLLDGCCPTYICDTDSSTSIIDTTEEGNATTIKPVASEKPIDKVDDEVEATSTEEIPKDVIMPSGITEQPLSHIKPDEETLLITTMTPALAETTTPATVDMKPLTEEDEDEIVSVTHAPEIMKEDQQPAEKEPEKKPEGETVSETEKPTTDETVKQEVPTSTPTADEAQPEIEDKLVPTTVTPASKDEDQPTKQTPAVQSETDDKTLATTISPATDEVSTESAEKEASSTEAHIDDIHKEPSATEKIPVSSTSLSPESGIADKITTLPPFTDTSKPSDEKISSDITGYGETTEAGITGTTVRPESDDDEDKKKLFDEASQTTKVTPTKLPEDKETSTEATSEIEPSKESGASTARPTSDEDKGISEMVPTSAPEVSKEQINTTTSPVESDEEKDSSTEKDSHKEEAEEKATTVAAPTEDEVSKTSKLPEDVHEPFTTVAPFTQKETKKPTEEEAATPASAENEIDTSSEASVTASPTDAEKESDKPTLPVEQDEENIGQTTMVPAHEEDSSEVDEKPTATDVPISDISKKTDKPQAEEIATEASSTESGPEKTTQTPSVPSSTPSDKDDKEKIPDTVTEAVSTDDEISSTEKPVSQEPEQPSDSTSKPQEPEDKVETSTSTPPTQDEVHKTPVDVVEEDVSATSAIPSQDDTKATSDEQTTASSSEFDLATTIASIVDKEDKKPSVETTSTTAPTSGEDNKESAVAKIDETTVASVPTETEEPANEEKPLDVSIQSTDSPTLEDISTESEEQVDHKDSSTTESATKLPTDVESEQVDKVTTVAPTSEKTTPKPFDEKEPPISAEKESTTAMPQDIEDKKEPSSTEPQEETKKPASENEIDQAPHKDSETTTQTPTSDEEDENISNEVFPTIAPVGDEIKHDEEDKTESTPSKLEPEDDMDSSTESKLPETEKPIETEPQATGAPSKEVSEGDESTTKHPSEEADKERTDKTSSTSAPSEETPEQPIRTTTPAIKADSTSPVADDKIDASTAYPIAEDDDTEGTTARPTSDKTETAVPDQGSLEDAVATSTESEEDKEASPIATTPKSEIATDSTVPPSHIPGAEEIDTKPVEDVMSQTIAPEVEDKKTPLDDGEAVTTSAEDADKIPVTLAPVAHDIEATSEVSKKPSAAEDVGEETTEPTVVDHEGITDEPTGAKLKPITPVPTVDEASTESPVEEPEIVAETVKPDKKTPETPAKMPELEMQTDRPSDIEKPTKAPVVVPSLDSTEEGEESVESEEEHTPASEDAHKEEESDESTEMEEPATEAAAKKPEHDKQEVPAVVSELPETTAPSVHAESSTETSSEEAVTEHPDIVSIPTLHPLFAQHATSTTKGPLPSIDDRLGEGETEAAPTKQSTETTTTESPLTTPSSHHEPITPPSYGQQPQYPSYPEDEYDEEEVFGPGTCRYAGKIYVSAQQIPRDDPCDFCFCFRSDIICLQQSCPPPISGCHEEPISGFCCPRYECPVSMAAVLNITTSTTTTSTTLPPHFLNYSHGDAVQHTGCLINGRSYKVGEPIESTSGPCISCTCGGDGKMKCNPQQCVPEPTMQQVLATYASSRKR